MTPRRAPTQHPARPTLDQIVRALRSDLPELRARHRVRSLGVFGSYARGASRGSSDVDLLVDFERAPTLFEFVELQEHLSALLGVKVDLVMRSALKPAIGERILAEVMPV